MMNSPSFAKPIRSACSSARRNQREPEQTKRLIDRFREAVGRDDAPVFTDQEGGRVQHLDA